MSDTDLRALSDIAIERRTTYRTIYDLALRGELGELVRLGSRLYVRPAEPAAESPTTSPRPAA